MIRRRVSILGQLMTVYAVRQGKREEWPIMKLGTTHPTIKKCHVLDGYDRRRCIGLFRNPNPGTPRAFS
jgi:hypothetical protein